MNNSNMIKQKEENTKTQEEQRNIYERDSKAER